MLRWDCVFEERVRGMVNITMVWRQHVDCAVPCDTEVAAHLEVTSIETVVYWSGLALYSRSVGLYLALYHVAFTRTISG